METNINLGTLSGTIHHIRRNEYPHGKVASFQLATQYFGRKKDGTPFCETTYHLVTAWESESIRPDLLWKVAGGISHTRKAETRFSPMNYLSRGCRY